MFKETYGYLMNDAPHAADFYSTMRTPAGKAQSYANPTAAQMPPSNHMVIQASSADFEAAT